MATIRQTINTFQLTTLEGHEVKKFGRFVVHDDPFFTELQKKTIGLVSEAAGEPVEASYNFVSLYKKVGVFPRSHGYSTRQMDIGPVLNRARRGRFMLARSLPGRNTSFTEDDWQRAIKESPDYEFASYNLEPGEALIFSGSSQWHYRDPMQLDGNGHFCSLVFFHFVPKGMLETVRPKNWARLIGIPELADL